VAGVDAGSEKMRRGNNSSGQVWFLLIYFALLCFVIML
jgi:hypothetical protein